MDLEGTTYILKQVLASELPQQSHRNRLWLLKLTQATDEDAALSLQIAKRVIHMLSGRVFVLLVEHNAVALFTEDQLRGFGIERIDVPGPYLYYAARTIPDRLLFRRKKQKKGQQTEDAATVVDLKTTWLEILPYEIRHIDRRLTIRAAAWLERARLRAECDIMHMGYMEEWKTASKQDRRAMDYCSITLFDRILTVNLLRRNLMKLTPRAKYAFHSSDIKVQKDSPARLHHHIISVSTANRYRLFPLHSTNEESKIDTLE